MLTSLLRVSLWSSGGAEEMNWMLLSMLCIMTEVFTRNGKVYFYISRKLETGPFV